MQEYQYLRKYLNTLKKHTLPALKAKIQAAALKEHKRIKKKIEALDAGYDDLIWLDNNGYLAECPASNIFVIKNDVI